MKTYTVLFLDDAPWFLPDLTEHGVELKAIVEGRWGDGRVYVASVEVCETVKKLTEGGEVDFVVVGNNMGAGVAKARAVANGMKDKTIVVWNSYRQGDEAPYAALGLKHFGSRLDLEQMVPAMLGVV